MPMTTKPCRGVTYHKGVPTIKSQDPFISWFCEIKWQTKNVIFPLPQGLWPQNLEGWFLTLNEFYPERNMII